MPKPGQRNRHSYYQDDSPITVRILQELQEAGEVGIWVWPLVDKLGADPCTVYNTLSTLRRLGIVRRDPKNRRYYLVSPPKF